LPLGRPDLVVADGIFARQAIAAGLETVAVADLDAPEAAVAALRGDPVVVVPAAARRPPSAYEPLLETILDALAADPAGAAPSPGPRDDTRQPPHLATETPGPYAAPESGGEEG